MIGLIPVRRGGRVIAWAQVDAVDIEAVSQYGWHLDSGGYPTGTMRERLHRFLIEVPAGFVVDHINRDKLDNRLSNLRVTTQQVNAQNTPGFVNAGSRFRGVYRDRRRGKWYAQVKHNGIRHLGGTFETEEDAARAAEQLRASIFAAPLVLPTVRRAHQILPPRDLSRCVHGHLWSENTRVEPQGGRRCRSCMRDASRRYEQRSRRSVGLR